MIKIEEVKNLKKDLIVWAMSLKIDLKSCPEWNLDNSIRYNERIDDFISSLLEE